MNNSKEVRITIKPLSFIGSVGALIENNGENYLMIRPGYSDANEEGEKWNNPLGDDWGLIESIETQKTVDKINELFGTSFSYDELNTCL